MKVIQVILFLAILFLTKSEDPKKCEDYGMNSNQPAFSLDFCRTTYYDKGNGQRCCFIKYKENEKRKYNCILIDNDDYLKIKDKIKSIKATNKEVTSLDCSSSYLYISLLFIFALIL